MRRIGIVSTALIVASMTGAATSVHAGQVAYWRFEEGAGQLAANDEAATLDLTLQLGTSQSTFADSAWTTSGFVGNALVYTPDTVTTITTGDQSSPLGTANMGALLSQTFTLEAFINLNTLPAVGFSSGTPYNVIEVRDIGGGFEDNYRLRVRNDGSKSVLELTYKRSGSTVTVTHTTALTAGNWYYVAASRAADKTVKLYVGDAQNDLGGTLDVVTSINSADVDLSAMTDPRLAIGAELKTTTGFQRSFDGIIDEVRISDTARTESDLLFNTIPEPTCLGLLGVGAMALLGRSARLA